MHAAGIPTPIAKRESPPLVLPRDLAGTVDLGNGAWPRYLVIPVDAGLVDACGLWHGLATANESLLDPHAYVPREPARRTTLDSQRVLQPLGSFSRQTNGLEPLFCPSPT